MKKHGIYVKLWSHHLHTWWFKAWISIFFLFSHKICTSFHPVSKLSSCSFNDCCWRSDSSWIHLGPLAMSCLKSGSRLSISSLRSSCSFSIFSASNRDTGISSDATSFWVLFSLEKKRLWTSFLVWIIYTTLYVQAKRLHFRDTKGGSIYVSGKLPTYPSPKPTFCPKGWFPLSRNFSVRTHVTFTRVKFTCVHTLKLRNSGNPP